MGVSVKSDAPSAVVTSTRPRASITVTSPLAVEYAVPVAAVSSQDLNTVVTYEVPVAAVSYIELVVSAELDARGLFQIFRDTSVVLDSNFIDVSKAIADEVNTPELVQLLVEKPLADEAVMVDFFSVWLFIIRRFEETISLSSAITTRSVGKALSHSVAPIDALARAFAKSLSDSQSLADAATLAIEKVLADSYALTDTTTFSASKGLFDSFALASAVTTLGFGKGLSDSQGLSDTESYDMAKVLADAFALNDTTISTDGVQADVSKLIANVAFAEDAEVWDFTKALSSSAPVEDTGALVSQSYCDLTYFAEDYVGESRSFT